MQAQWRMWVDYALAAGSPIGVAGLEKTVITAATYRKGRWVDVPVKLKVPKTAGGMLDLPDCVPQMRFDDAYPHMGIPRSICGNREFLIKKFRKGTVALVTKLKRVNLDRGQHIRCANCLKGSYAGYYAAAAGLTLYESDGLERLWRMVFRCTFKLQHHVPVAHLYGGAVNGVADSLHGRHLLVDAVGALYSTCRRALASPEDSIERATARSGEEGQRLGLLGCSDELAWFRRTSGNGC